MPPTDDADGGSDSSPSEADLSDDERILILPPKALSTKQRLLFLK